uniref:RNA helicase n=1 Tax=Ananas comosus var. bracteatus TaxID=296719 RepID=A0A6V7P6L8_ANACO|nr:unnamed protein product [Ananas comosus var. bracteatus]
MKATTYSRPHRPYPPPAPPFEVLLARSSARRGPPPRTSTPSSPPSRSPCRVLRLPLRPLAGRLCYRREVDALDAVVFLWRRRLQGAHHLSPKVAAASAARYDLSEEAARLRALFAGHAHALLKGEAAERCSKKIEKLTVEIAKVDGMLRRRNPLKSFGELRSNRKQLESEREQLKGNSRSSERPWVELGPNPSRDVARVPKARGGLPIYACRRSILRNIISNQVSVLIGETGSGKSTQLVQFLADSGLADEGSIVCTQPRKIASTSLAQRVAEETNGCYEDYSVTSYPTFSSLQCFTYKVIFMTDHCLLQHYMNDDSLAGISHIIVDEAHERSLNTDMLLALLKKKLLKRFDLRLIIMSATADARKLSDYFDSCRTFNFPATLVSYVSDVLKMVSVIHKTEEDGGILAFLTSQMEVEWACERFSDPSAVVLPMHGKLSSEEQSRVFQNYPGKRKIIFSTNVAETSLTIQGVKYVVDSGMVKDIMFEPKNGMNVLKVCRTSQSSANQRAGRAGRTEPGKCYRLYSQHDYQLMQTHQEPEIHKVHLGIACLRILALGIKDIQEFEFIDAPSPCAIDTAMQNLIRIGAVIRKNGLFELTGTGRCLVKLGVEPRLGKIILDCFSCGLRKEGVVLAAVMANSSSIFCRVGTDEEKFKADRLKVPFCHRGGDLFTLLSVYKEWESEHENRNKWCWENSINAKSMRRCRDTILELENCLQNELNVIVPSYWLWDRNEPTEHDKSLKKVLLLSLADNTAMYSGSDLESQKMVMNVTTGVGYNLIRRLCGKSNHNLRCLVSNIQEECMDNHITIDVDFDKREIQLLALAKDMEKASKGVALVSCAKEDVDFIAKDCFALIIGDRYVNCNVSVKYPNCLFVTGIPKDIGEQEVYDAFKNATKRRILNVRLLRGDAINNLPVSTYAEALVKEIAPFMPNKNLPNCNFQVEVYNYEPKDYMVKAMITFDGSLHGEAANALDHIQGKVLSGCFPWQKIQCQHIFSSSLSCPSRIYFVIKGQLDHLLEGFKHEDGAYYKQDKNENGSIRITISANSPKIIADLRKPLEQLMKGKTISHQSLTPTILQLLLSRDGVRL